MRKIGERSALSGSAGPSSETANSRGGINRRRVLKLGGGLAVASVAAPLLTRSPDAGAATTLTSAKVVMTLAPNQTSVTFPSGAADQVNFTTNAAAGGTLTVLQPSGSPTDGQSLECLIKSSNPQTYSWASVFRGSLYGNLPPTTSGQFDYFLFNWRTSASCWDMLTNVQGIT